MNKFKGVSESLDPQLLLKLGAKIDRQMDPHLYPTKKRKSKPKLYSESLSLEQKKVIDLVTVQRKSLFFTGAAGTGKSFLLKAIIETLGELGLSHATAVTATTGIAACNIGGITIHSFAGVGLGDGSFDEMVEKVMHSSYSKKRWRKCEILIIDEISMMNGVFFETLSILGARIRKDPRPFGGIQLVCCGDFYQLPPVGVGSPRVTFCFEAPCWRSALPCIVELSQPFRQRDETFVTLLNDIRTGNPSQSTINTLRMCDASYRNKTTMKVDTFTDQKEPHSKKAKMNHDSSVDQSVVDSKLVSTKLFSKNSEVDKVNAMELSKLSSTSHVYLAKDGGDERLLESLNKHSQGASSLELKQGAQVMLLKNLDIKKGLVNGAQGVVIGFQHYQPHEEDYAGGGGNLDEDERCQGSFKKEWGKLPLVEFVYHGRQHHVLVEPQEWSVTTGSKIATRSQIPLRCAWAISIHKSQGMTISHLEVNLAGCFEYGQAYVALSRASNLETLTLTGFNPNKKCIRAHKKVIEFYNNLQNIQSSLDSSTSETHNGRQDVSSSSSSSSIKQTLTTTPLPSSSSSSTVPWKCPGMQLASSDGWITRKPLSDFNDKDPPEKDEWMERDVQTPKFQQKYKTNQSNSFQQSTGTVGSTAKSNSRLLEPKTSINDLRTKASMHRDTATNTPSSSYSSSSSTSTLRVLSTSKKMTTDDPSDIRTQNKARVLAMMAGKGRKILY